MPVFDLSLPELRSYRPERSEPDDFDRFWSTTLAEAREYERAPQLRPYDLELPLVDVQDVEFAGFGGDRVRGWFLAPKHGAGTVPCVVRFLGYGDGRGTPLDWLAWPAAGYAFMVMDTRGQGGDSRRAGATADRTTADHPGVPGSLTIGVTEPEHTYYRRVYVDAVRAVETAVAQEPVDPRRVAVHGSSQGGGIALAAAALSGQVAAALVDVPFLCLFRRALEVTDQPPYLELLTFLRTHRDRAEQALRTLDYVDGVNMAARATVPALFSVALMDQVCPPSTVFAAYNHYSGPKEIDVWPYNEHEGGGVHQDERQVRWLRALFAEPRPPRSSACSSA